MNDQTKPLLSSSEERLFKTCRQAHYFQYVLGYGPAIANRKLRTGIVVHRGLEAYYRGGGPDDIVAEMEEEANDQWATILANPAAIDYDEAKENFDKDQVLALAMVGGYPEWVAESGIDDDWEVVSVEEGAIIEIPGAAHDLPMRLDLVQRNIRSGHLRIRDFKTARAIPKDMTPYHLSEQNGNYILGAMAIYGEMPHEFSYVFLRKIIPSGRSKPPYYKEATVYRTSGELVQRVEEFTVISNEIADGYAVYPSPENCCGSWKNDWARPCLLVHQGMEHEEALELVPGFEKREQYRERYADVMEAE